MDFFAHALWTNVVYYKKYKADLKNRLWSVFFGIMPDLISFTPVTIYSLFFHPKWDPNLYVHGQAWLYQWARDSYNYTHSLVSFAAVTALVLAARRGKMYWPILGWALHIVIDIFTHKNFFETPFLFPLSRFRFDRGVSWAEPRFMLINYAVLAAIYVFIFYFPKNRDGQKK